MDELASFLDGPRAQDAFLLRSMFDSPWSLRIQDEAPLTVLSMVRGDAWIAFDGGTSRALSAGDVAVIRDPDPYTVSDTPDGPARGRSPCWPPRSACRGPPWPAASTTWSASRR